ncbi:hypothetical protein BDW75DRAFT_226560 [Aspergillus navahoensis]
MEAFGVAASVLQVAAVGLALAQLLHGLCDEASSSNEQVKELAFLVKSTSSVFEEIGKVFQDEGAAETPIISQNAISTVKEIIAKCTATFEDLEGMVADAEQSALGLIKFTIKASRVKVLQLGLWEMRSNLQCMMQVIVYARMKARTDSVFNDSEQRKLITSLIREQLLAAEQYRQANPQALPSNGDGLAASLRGGADQAITSTEAKSKYDQFSTVTATVSHTKRARLLEVPAPPWAGEGTTHQPETEAQPRSTALPEATRVPAKPQISYREALAIVCCPWLAQHSRVQDPDGDPELRQEPITTPPNERHVLESRHRISNALRRLKSTISIAAHDRLNDYEFAQGPPLDFPDIPAEEQRNPELAAIRARNNSRRSILSMASSGYPWPPSDGSAMEVESESKLESDVDRLVRKWTTLYC